jgi:hypothetical protein
MPTRMVEILGKFYLSISPLRTREQRSAYSLSLLETDSQFTIYMNHPVTRSRKTNRRHNDSLWQLLQQSTGSPSTLISRYPSLVSDVPEKQYSTLRMFTSFSFLLLSRSKHYSKVRSSRQLRYGTLFRTHHGTPVLAMHSIA